MVGVVTTVLQVVWCKWNGVYVLRTLYIYMYSLGYISVLFIGRRTYMEVLTGPQFLTVASRYGGY